MMSRIYLSSIIRSFATLNESVAALRKNPEDLYEPKDVCKMIIVKTTKKEYPEYGRLIVRLRGFDYAILERYQSFVHKTAKRFQLKVDESYATAARTHRIVLYKPNSTLVEYDCDMAVYERNVKLSEVPTIKLPVFADLISTHLPIGVDLTLKVYDKTDDESRYIPDLMLQQKQQELKSLDNPIVRKQLGWE